MARNSRTAATADAAATGEDGIGTPPRRDIRLLRRLWVFMGPYKLQIAGALVALTIAASTVLALGLGLRRLVDDGFARSDPSLLDDALIVLGIVIVVLAAATYARFFIVSWVGERVVADIRRAVFSRVLEMSPGYFETTRVGEVMSRLTTDTTLLQSIVGT